MDAAAKQQIIDRVKQANNILVTVSTNPSVDQLAACVGLTLLLNRMDKHATAVFSGHVPSTLEFLQPEKTIETTTDSLRDFIISLDKNKADKLRYKVEDQVVRIFITPYKSSLSENDLVFSQGDYNVEVVIALGIQDKTHIDAAITAHGRILHDATVISLVAGQSKVQPLGQINWQDATASSLCEMIVSISEAFGTGLIDNQMATSFLTGIVAETNRFSNNKTTSKVMTISAQLMAAGANQQLIVSKLEPPTPPVQKYMPGQPPSKPAYKGKPEATLSEGTLNVQKAGTDKTAEIKLKPDEIHIDAQGNLRTAADLATGLQTSPEAPPQNTPVSPSPAYLGQPSTSANPAVQTPPTPAPGPHALLNPDIQSPVSEGIFTANTQPEWAYTQGASSYDPLSANNPSLVAANPGTTAATQPSVPAVDAARDAVKGALATAPFDAGYLPPTQTLNAIPIDMGQPNLQPQAGTGQPSPNQSSPPPPPFPPPLSSAQGAVIPDSKAG